MPGRRTVIWEVNGERLAGRTFTEHDTMEFTAADIEDIKARAAKDLADRIWAKVENACEEIVAFSPARAAGMLDLSSSQLNRVTTEELDFSGQTKRLTIAMLKRLTASRTVRKKS